MNDSYDKITNAMISFTKWIKEQNLSSSEQYSLHAEIAAGMLYGLRNTTVNKSQFLH